MEMVMSKAAWEAFLASCGEEEKSWTEGDAKRLRAFFEGAEGTGRRLMRKLLMLQGELEELLLNAPTDFDPQIRQLIEIKGRRRGIMIVLEIVAEAVMFDYDPDDRPISDETASREEI